MRGKIFVEVLNVNDFVNSGSFFTSQILPHVITLAAAFFGAWFAFLLSKRDSKKIKEKEEISSLNQVIVHFILQWNELLNIKEKHIKPAIERAGKELLWMHLEALLFIEPSIFKVDSSSLHFLMDSGDANLIQEIFIERTGYTQVLNLINLRSEKHRTDLQDKFEEFNKTDQNPQTDKEYEAYIGERLTGEMKTYTEQIIDGIEKSIDGHYDLIQKLHKTGIKIFPNENILTVKRTDQNK